MTAQEIYSFGQENANRRQNESNGSTVHFIGFSVTLGCSQEAQRHWVRVRRDYDAMATKWLVYPQDANARTVLASRLVRVVGGLSAWRDLILADGRSVRIRQDFIG